MAGIGGCVFNNDRNQMINLRPSVQFRKMRAAYGVSGWRPVAFRIAFRRYAGGYPSHYGMCRLGSSMCGKVIRTARKASQLSRPRGRISRVLHVARVVSRGHASHFALRLQSCVPWAAFPGRRAPPDTASAFRYPPGFAFWYPPGCGPSHPARKAAGRKGAVWDAAFWYPPGFAFWYPPGCGHARPSHKDGLWHKERGSLCHLS